MDTLGSSSFTGTRSEIEPLTRLWILRLLVPLGGYNEPPRVLWRLKSLRGLSHEVEQVFP